MNATNLKNLNIICTKLVTQVKKMKKANIETFYLRFLLFRFLFKNL